MLDIQGFIDRQFPESIPAGNPVTDMRVQCPFCGDEKYHLYISLDKQTCHCFRCGYSASWVRLVMDILGCKSWKAVGELYHKPRMVDFDKQINILSHTTIIKEALPSDVELPEDFKIATDSDGELGAIARKYLYSRGYGNDVITKYSLGVAPSIPWRVIIPIEGAYWQGRRLYKWMSPKYINPKFEAKAVLFNSRALRSYEEVVICEGAFSAISVGDNAIALIGKEPTDQKVDRLVQSSVNHFIITVEPEAWGTIGLLAKRLYRAGKSVTLWVFNSGDPANSYDFQIYPYNSRTIAYMCLYK